MNAARRETLRHDLRAPIASILGCAETMMDGVPDEGTRRAFLRIIERNARRLIVAVDAATAAPRRRRSR